MENRSCYGKAFRQLRLDRGYSLKEAAGNYYFSTNARGF